jgi:hypothetical protein
MKSRDSDTYTRYGIGSAVVWAALLVTGRAVLDEKNWERLRLGAGTWWAPLGSSTSFGS